MKDQMLSCQVHTNGTLPYNYISNSEALWYLMYPPHFSLLREVFSYIARFLPSKRYYLFLFTEHSLIFLSCFKSTRLWRFHFLPFTMPQASPCFLEDFIYFSFIAVPLEHSFSFCWVHLTPEGFLFFLQLQDAICIYELAIHLYTQELFMGFIFFPLFVHNAIGMCPSQQSCMHRNSWRF